MNPFTRLACLPLPGYKSGSRTSNEDYRLGHAESKDN
jgi:hypothetical protein